MAVIALIVARLLSSAASPVAPPIPPAPPAVQVVDAAVNGYRYPEVRLRKLHLVRPDLLQYPIEFQIYC